MCTLTKKLSVKFPSFNSQEFFNCSPLVISKGKWNNMYSNLWILHLSGLWNPSSHKSKSHKPKAANKTPQTTTFWNTILQYFFKFVLWKCYPNLWTWNSNLWWRTNRWTNGPRFSRNKYWTNASKITCRIFAIGKIIFFSIQVRIVKDSYRNRQNTTTLIFENLEPVEIIKKSFEHLKSCKHKSYKP